jgi:hypothetical protein
MRLLPFLACAVACSGFGSSWANAQTVIYTFDAPSSATGFGSAVTSSGDTDLDGRPDLVVAAPLEDAAGLTEAGRLRVYSGASGVQVGAAQGSQAFDHLGSWVTGLGDVDGDGTPDSAALGIGYVRVYSGATGSVLHDLLPPGPTLMHEVHPVGDWDADGYSDIGVGAGNDARVFVYSSQNGNLLKTFSGGISFGQSFDGVGDVNSDGWADIAIGSPLYDGRRGKVEVYSGLDGAILLTFVGPEINMSLGHSVAAAGFVDTDSVPDIVVGAPNNNSSAQFGQVYVYSGQSGQQLHKFLGAGLSHLGSSVAGAGDLNGDARADLAMAAQTYVRAYSGAEGALLFEVPGLKGPVAAAGDVNGDGRLDVLAGAADKAVVISGVPLALSANVHEFSLATGGVQSLTLQAGPAQAGRLYLVLGTLSGTTPGLHVPPVTVPLNYDAYFEYTLLHPDSPPLSASFGLLSQSGTAAAAFSLPAGLGLPAPLELNHAFVVLSLPSLQLEFASNANPLTLQP